MGPYNLEFSLSKGSEWEQEPGKTEVRRGIIRAADKNTGITATRAAVGNAAGNAGITGLGWNASTALRKKVSTTAGNKMFRASPPMVSPALAVGQACLAAQGSLSKGIMRV